MSTLFESIKQGLNEAIAHQKGEAIAAKVHTPTPLDVKAIRSNTGLTQESFAARFGFSVGTLRHWERGDRQPHGAARVLLQVIAKNPQAVLESLA
jgi:putative transcriptional regulator